VKLLLLHAVHAGVVDGSNRCQKLLPGELFIIDLANHSLLPAAEATASARTRAILP
jgi:hypothetical protein